MPLSYGKGASIQMAKLFWGIFRYLLVSLIIMVLALSVATNQFPPPIFKIVKQIREAMVLVDMSQANMALLKAQEEKMKVLREIERDSPLRDFSAAPEIELPQLLKSKNLNEPPVPSFSEQADRKIKSLEYEVAYLKAKLSRAESEVQELRNQIATSVKK